LFNKPNDLPYLRFMRRLHAAVLFDWYLEIGCRTGRSMQNVRGKTIGVDPFFRIENNVIGQKSAFMAFQQKSDDFFASNVLKSLGIKLSFSFLDGMHLMEYLLRDFMNAEANSRHGAVIAMHDCCPYDHEMTTRDVENAPRRAWTGDVWKLLPILQQYRPDLVITVLGCQPTGLVLVSNLDPQNCVLRDNYDDIVSSWQDLTLADYGVAKFYDSFAYTNVKELFYNRFALFDKVRLDPQDADTPIFVSP